MPVIIGGGSGSGNFAALPNAGEKVVYVSTFGSDSNAGLDRGNPKLTLASAVSALGTTPGVILAGQGAFGFTNLSLRTGQRIVGAGKNATTLSCTGTGTAIGSATPGTRSYGQGLAHLTLSTTTAATAVDLDSVSSGAFESVVVNGFSTVGFTLHSTTLGGAVYNRFWDVTVQNTPTGYQLRNASNATAFYACRANVVSSFGFDIQDCNDVTLDGCQIENFGTGVFLDSATSGAASWNRIRNCRLEAGTTGININSANVNNTVIDGLWYDSSTTTPIVDNGLTTRRAQLLMSAKATNSVVSLDSGWQFVSGASVTLGGTSSQFAAATNAALYLRGDAPNSTAQVAAWIGNRTTLTGAQAKVVGFCADTPVTHAVPVSYIDVDGSYEFASGPKVMSGSGAPAVAAPVGSLYLRTDGGSGSTLYVKESGTGTSGWVAK